VSLDVLQADAVPFQFQGAGQARPMPQPISKQCYSLQGLCAVGQWQKAPALLCYAALYGLADAEKATDGPGVLVEAGVLQQKGECIMLS